MLQILKLLGKHGLSHINASDTYGNTVLHLTVKNKELAMEEKIKILDISLNSDVDPDAENRYNETALKLAIASRARDIIEFLLTRKVKIDNSIAEYVVTNEYERFQKLLERALEISETEIQKEESESRSFLEWLISKGLLNIDYQNGHEQSAVFMATKYSLHHLLPVLLKYTNDVKYMDPKTIGTLLHLFMESNNSLRHCCWFSAETFNGASTKQLYPNYIRRYAFDIIKIMLDRGISPDAVDANEDTALHVAIANEENIDIIKMLIEHTKNVNHKNSGGMTPFNTAISMWASLEQSGSGHYMEICRALIAKGANVNEQDNYGTSPLCNAVEKHHLKTVELLSENNADFNVTLPNGESLLHLYVKNCNPIITGDNAKIKIFDNLISSGCKVNAKDETGETALHIAARKGNVMITQKLIENGAKLNCKNNRGETPLCCLVYIYDQNKYMYGEPTNRPRQQAPQLPFQGNLDLNDAMALFLANVGNREDIRVEIYNEMLELLLKYGADINAQVSDGHSILRIAFWRMYRKGGYRRNIAIDDLPSFTKCMRDYNCRKVEGLLIHWIRLRVAHLKCNASFKYADLMKGEQYRKIHFKCQREIEKLKKTSIDSRATLYKLLHMDLNSRRAYINNEKVQQFIQSPKLEEQFPQYSVLIFSSYHEAITRKSLMNPAKKTWLDLTEIRLPEVCIELIFSFMSNTEMFYFIEKSRHTY